MKPKYKRLASVVVLISIMFLGAFVLLKTFSDNLVYFYAPKDLAELQRNQSQKFSNLSGRKIRVGGMIKKGSVKRISDKVSFIVTDYKDEIKIFYKGILPPMFREGQGVVAEGFLHKPKKNKKSKAFKFKAKKLITKHDEKYMPPELRN